MDSIQEHFTEDACDPKNFNFLPVEATKKSFGNKRRKIESKLRRVREWARKKDLERGYFSFEPEESFQQLPSSFRKITSAGMVDNFENSDLEDSGGDLWPG